MNRFDRLKNLIDIKSLQNKNIAVIGLGGVGSVAAETLVRSGVSIITLCDFDKVELSNINRQILALENTIGKYKTDVLEERFKNINPNLIIKKFTLRAKKQNFSQILQNVNFVIDAIDSLSDKADLIEFLYSNKIPFVSSMGTANRINPFMFEFIDISQTKNDPLARRLRKELKKRGIEKGFEVLISKEQPLITKQLSSVMFVTASAGLQLAYFSLKKLKVLKNE